MCPKCFHKNGELIEVNEREKETYVECVLANKTYTKEYKIFEGRVPIYMRSLTSRQADLMARSLQGVDLTDPANGEIAQKVKLVFYLAQYRDTEYRLPETDSLEEILGLFDERFGNLSEDVIGILVRVLMEFVRLLGFLLGSGFDKDFWQGVGID
jgi:hypothetical protein